MPQPRRLLISVDNSDASEAAVKWVMSNRELLLLPCDARHPHKASTASQMACAARRHWPLALSNALVAAAAAAAAAGGAAPAR